AEKYSCASAIFIFLSCPISRLRRETAQGWWTHSSCTLPSVAEQGPLPLSHSSLIFLSSACAAPARRRAAERAAYASATARGSDATATRGRGDARAPAAPCGRRRADRRRRRRRSPDERSEKHTSELQSLAYLVCRLLRE